MLTTTIYIVIGGALVWLLIRWFDKRNANIDAYVPDHYEPRKTITPPPVVKVYEESSETTISPDTKN